MIHRTFRRAVLAALLLLAAAPAAAQNERAIRPREAATVQAADLYQLVALLRPRWINPAGDTAAPSPAMWVFVDGRNVGGLNGLRGLTTDSVHSIRLGVGERRDTSEVLDPVLVPVLLVRYGGPRAIAASTQVTLGVGIRSLLADRARDDLAAGGWVPGNTPDDKSVPPATWVMRLGVAHHLRPDAGLAGSLTHTTAEDVRGGKFISFEGVTGSFFTTLTHQFTATEVAVTPFVENRALRAAAGPALRRASYTQAVGVCACRDEQHGTLWAPGAAAELGARVAGTRNFLVQATVSGRWFASHRIPGRYDSPALELGGLSVYTTVEAGFSL